MPLVKLHIPGVAEPRQMTASNVTELLENLEAPEGYEIKLLRTPAPVEGSDAPALPELLTESSELHEGDEIDVQPVLKGAAEIVRPKDENEMLTNRIRELISAKTYPEIAEELNISVSRVKRLAKKASLSRRTAKTIKIPVATVIDAGGRVVLCPECGKKIEVPIMKGA